MSKLVEQLLGQMPELTFQRCVELATENAASNRPHVKSTILEIQRAGPREGSALVFGAGPSLHRRDPAKQVLQAGYQGELIACDGALGYCLRNGIVPAYVVCLDPHPTRIVRWFGDPNIHAALDDDYFRQQDLDPHIAEKEIERNRELSALVDRHGPQMKAVLSTSVSPAVRKRCEEAGMSIYWWNPILDDVDDPRGVTRRLHDANGAPCMVTGGNSGAAAWVVAHQIRRRPEVALVGIDFGYPPDTPLEKTQYFKEIRELFGGRADEFFIPVHNPHVGETWYSDPAYYWYRENFLQMAQAADCTTYNCTEGGILFGEGVRSVRLADFLREHAPGG